MYILLALIVTVAGGVAVHFTLPLRHLRGAALTPAIAGALGGVGYTALTWLGFAQSDVWLWVFTIGGSLVLSVVVTLLVCRMRAAADRRERERLKIA